MLSLVHAGLSQFIFPTRVDDSKRYVGDVDPSTTGDPCPPTLKALKYANNRIYSNLSRALALTRRSARTQPRTTAFVCLFRARKYTQANTHNTRGAVAGGGGRAVRGCRRGLVRGPCYPHSAETQTSLASAPTARVRFTVNFTRDITHISFIDFQ